MRTPIALVAFLFALAVSGPSFASDVTALLGTWVGIDGERMVLEPGGVGIVDGNRVTWKIVGNGRVQYSVGGETSEAAYVLQGDQLTVMVGGQPYQYRRTARPAAPIPNPPVSPSPAEQAGVKVPPTLTGAYKGETTPFQHPRGWYAFELPMGWQVTRQTEEGLLINPGLQQTGTLDALIIMRHGELDEEDQNRPVSELVESYAPELRQGLAAEGITITSEKNVVKSVLVGETPGAEISWSGTAGTNPVTVWLGGLVKRHYYLATLAVMVKGKEERFLPGVKRVFQSMQPTPPQRNPNLERALAGRQLFRVNNNDSGSSSVSYKFDHRMGVKKSIYISGLSGTNYVSGSTDSYGRYEVINDMLYLYFKDRQSSGRIFAQNGAPTHVMFGASRYIFR